MEDWLPVRDVEGLPIAGLALERARLERRSRGQRHVEARDSLAASRLLATLPPADIVRRPRGAVSLHPARLPGTRGGALLASSLLACATIFMTLYALSKGGVFDAGDNQAPRAGTIRHAQAALRVAGQAQQGPEHDLGREPTKPASVGAQAGN